MVVTRAQYHTTYFQETHRLASINPDDPEFLATPFEPVVHRPAFVSSMEEQFMNTWAKEQIKNLPKFGGSVEEDVLNCLQGVGEVFDRAQIQSSNRFMAIQPYLVDAAAKSAIGRSLDPNSSRPINPLSTLLCSNSSSDFNPQPNRLWNTTTTSCSCVHRLIRI